METVALAQAVIPVSDVVTDAPVLKNQRKEETMKQKNRNISSLPDEFESVKVDCYNKSDGCDGFKIVVVPLGKKPQRILCSSCKRFGTPSERHNFPSGGAERTTVRADGDVTTYRPGDRGFASRAAECTPIKDIAKTSDATRYLLLGS